MKKYATVDPTTGKVVREFDTMSDPDVQQALARALVAYQSWRSADLADRAALLSRVADLHRQHAGELAELTTLEMGKPIAQAKAEVELSAAIYEYYATTGPAASCRRGARYRRPRAGAGPHRSDRAAAGRHAVELPLLPGRSVRGAEPAAGQHDPAQTRQQLPAAGAADRRDHRRRRRSRRGVPERVRLQPAGGDDDRQPTAARRFADRLRTSRQSGRRARRTTPQEMRAGAGRIRPVDRASGCRPRPGRRRRRGRPVRQRGPGLHLVQAAHRRGVSVGRLPRGVCDQGRRLAGR